MRQRATTEIDGRKVRRRIVTESLDDTWRIPQKQPFNADAEVAELLAGRKRARRDATGQEETTRAMSPRERTEQAKAMARYATQGLLNTERDPGQEQREAALERLDKAGVPKHEAFALVASAGLLTPQRVEEFVAAVRR